MTRVCFFIKAPGKLSGIMGNYVDGSIGTGTTDFLAETAKTEKRFETKKKEFSYFRFAGSYIEANQNGYVIHQQSYAEKLQYVNQNYDSQDFRSARSKLTWLTHTGPEVCATVNIIAQCTPESFCSKKFPTAEQSNSKN